MEFLEKINQDIKEVFIICIKISHKYFWIARDLKLDLEVHFKTIK